MRSSASTAATWASSPARPLLGGARLLVVVGGDGSVNEVVNGLAGLDRAARVALIPRGTGGDFVRTFGIPDDVADGGPDRARRRDAADRPRPRHLPRLGRPRGGGAVRERRERGHERRDRPACERHVEGSRREGVVPVGDVRRVRRLVGGRDARRRRRRDPQRADVRRRRRERALLRRRDEDVPGCDARRRPPRRRHDRRRDASAISC